MCAEVTALNSWRAYLYCAPQLLFAILDSAVAALYIFFYHLSIRNKQDDWYFGFILRGEYDNRIYESIVSVIVKQFDDGPDRVIGNAILDQRIVKKYDTHRHS